MSAYLNTLKQLGFKDPTQHQKGKGRISRLSSISRQLFKAHYDGYHPRMSRQLATALKRFINIRPKHERKTAEFVGEVRRKILCLHEYNVQIAKVKLKYPQSEQFDAVLIQYIELECELLYDGYTEVVKELEDSVTQRVLRLLKVILHDALQNSDIPLKTTINACDKALLKIFANVRADCVFENKLVANTIVKLLNKLNLLDEVNQLKGKNIPYHQDTVLRDPLVFSIRQNLTTSDYESDIDYDSDDEGDTVPVVFDDIFNCSTQKPQHLFSYGVIREEKAKVTQSSKNLEFSRAFPTKNRTEERKFSTVAFANEVQPRSADTFFHNELSRQERTVSKDPSNEFNFRLSRENPSSETFFQNHLKSFRNEPIRPLNCDNLAQIKSNKMDISDHFELNSAFFNKGSDILSNLYHHTPSITSKCPLDDELVDAEDFMLSLNGNITQNNFLNNLKNEKTIQKDKNTDFAQNRSVDFKSSQKTVINSSEVTYDHQAMIEDPTDINLSNEERTSRLGFCDESYNNVEGKENSQEAQSREKVAEPSKELTREEDETAETTEQSVSVEEVNTTETSPKIPMVTSTTDTKPHNETEVASEVSDLVDSTGDICMSETNARLEIDTSATTIAIDVDALPDTSFASRTPSVIEDVNSGLITIDLLDDEDETNYVNINHNGNEGQSSLAFNNSPMNLLQSNEIKLEENEENHSPNFPIPTSDNNERFLSSNKGSRNSTSTGFSRFKNNSSNDSAKDADASAIIISDSEDEFVDVAPNYLKTSGEIEIAITCKQEIILDSPVGSSTNLLHEEMQNDIVEEQTEDTPECVLSTLDNAKETTVDNSESATEGADSSEAAAESVDTSVTIEQPGTTSVESTESSIDAIKETDSELQQEIDSVDPEPSEHEIKAVEPERKEENLVESTHVEISEQQYSTELTSLEDQQVPVVELSEKVHVSIANENVEHLDVREIRNENLEEVADTKTSSSDQKVIEDDSVITGDAEIPNAPEVAVAFHEPEIVETLVVPSAQSDQELVITESAETVEMSEDLEVGEQHVKPTTELQTNEEGFEVTAGLLEDMELQSEEVVMTELSDKPEVHEQGDVDEERDVSAPVSDLQEKEADIGKPLEHTVTEPAESEEENNEFKSNVEVEISASSDNELHNKVSTSTHELEVQEQHDQGRNDDKSLPEDLQFVDCVQNEVVVSESIEYIAPEGQPVVLEHQEQQNEDLTNEETPETGISAVSEPLDLPVPENELVVHQQHEHRENSELKNIDVSGSVSSVQNEEESEPFAHPASINEQEQTLDKELENNKDKFESSADPSDVYNEKIVVSVPFDEHSVPVDEPSNHEQQKQDKTTKEFEIPVDPSCIPQAEEVLYSETAELTLLVNTQPEPVIDEPNSTNEVEVSADSVCESQNNVVISEVSEPSPEYHNTEMEEKSSANANEETEVSQTTTDESFELANSEDALKMPIESTIYDVTEELVAGNEQEHIAASLVITDQNIIEENVEPVAVEYTIVPEPSAYGNVIVQSSPVIELHTDLAPTNESFQNLPEDRVDSVDRDNICNPIDYSVSAQYVQEKSSDVAIYSGEESQFPPHTLQNYNMEALQQQVSDPQILSSSSNTVQNAIVTEVPQQEPISDEIELKTPTVCNALSCFALSKVEYGEYNEEKKVGDLELLANIAADQETLAVKTDSEKETLDVASDVESAQTLDLLQSTPKRRKSKVKFESKKKVLVRETLPRAVKQFQKKHPLKQKLKVAQPENKRVTRNGGNKPKTDEGTLKEIQKQPKVNRTEDPKYKPHDFISVENSILPPRTNNVYAQKRCMETNTTSEDSNDSCESTLFIDLGEKTPKSVYDEETICDMLEFVTTESKMPVCISIPENAEICISDSIQILKQMEDFVDSSQDAISDDVAAPKQASVEESKPTTSMAEPASEGKSNEDIVVAQDNLITDENPEEKSETKIVKTTDHSIENILNKIPLAMEVNVAVIPNKIEFDQNTPLDIEKGTPIPENVKIDALPVNSEVVPVFEPELVKTRKRKLRTFAVLNQESTVDVANITAEGTESKTDKQIPEDDNCNEPKDNIQTQPENLTVEKKSSLSTLNSDDNLEKTFKTKAAMKSYDDKLHQNPYVLLHNFVNSTLAVKSDVGMRTRLRSKSSEQMHQAFGVDRFRSSSVDFNAMPLSTDPFVISAKLEKSKESSKIIDTVCTADSAINKEKTDNGTTDSSADLDNIPKNIEKEQDSSCKLDPPVVIINTAVECTENANKISESAHGQPEEVTCNFDEKMPDLENIQKVVLQEDKVMEDYNKDVAVTIKSPVAEDANIASDSLIDVQKAPVENLSQEVEPVNVSPKNTNVKKDKTPDKTTKLAKTSDEPKGTVLENTIKKMKEKIVGSKKAKKEQVFVESPQELENSMKEKIVTSEKAKKEDVAPPSLQEPDNNVKEKIVTSEKAEEIDVVPPSLQEPDNNMNEKMVTLEKAEEIDVAPPSLQGPDNNLKEKIVTSEKAEEKHSSLQSPQEPDNNVKEKMVASETSIEENISVKSPKQSENNTEEKIVELETAEKEHTSLQSATETENNTNSAQKLPDTEVVQQTEIQISKEKSDVKQTHKKPSTEDPKQKPIDAKKKDDGQEKRSRSRSSSKSRTSDKKSDQDKSPHKSSRSRSSSKSSCSDKRKHHSDSETDRKRRSKSKSVDVKTNQSQEEPNGHKKRSGRSPSKSKSSDSKSKSNPSDKSSSKHKSTDLKEKQSNKGDHKKSSSKSPPKSKSPEVKLKQSHTNEKVDKEKLKDVNEDAKDIPSSTKTSKSKTKVDQNSHPPDAQSPSKESKDADEKMRMEGKTLRTKSKRQGKLRENNSKKVEEKPENKSSNKHGHKNKATDKQSEQQEKSEAKTIEREKHRDTHKTRLKEKMSQAQSKTAQVDEKQSESPKKDSRSKSTEKSRSHSNEKRSRSTSRTERQDKTKEKPSDDKEKNKERTEEHSESDRSNKKEKTKEPEKNVDEEQKSDSHIEDKQVGSSDVDINKNNFSNPEANVTPALHIVSDQSDQRKEGKDRQKLHKVALPKKRKYDENQASSVQNKKSDSTKPKIPKIDVETVATSNISALLESVNTPNIEKQNEPTKDLDHADSSASNSLEDQIEVKTSSIQNDKCVSTESKISKIDAESVSTTSEKNVVLDDIKTPVCAVESNDKQKYLELADSSTKDKVVNKTSSVQTEKRDSAKSKMQKSDIDGVSSANAKDVLPKDIKVPISSNVESNDKEKTFAKHLEHADSSTKDKIETKTCSVLNEKPDLAKSKMQKSDIDATNAKYVLPKDIKVPISSTVESNDKQKKSSKDFAHADSPTKNKRENKTSSVQSEKRDSAKSKIHNIGIDGLLTRNGKDVVPDDIQTSTSSAMENSDKQKKSSKDLKHTNSSTESKTSSVQSEKRVSAKSKIQNIDIDGFSATHVKDVRPEDIKPPNSNAIEDNEKQKKSSKDLKYASSTEKTSSVANEKRGSTNSKIQKIDIDDTRATNTKDVKTPTSSTVENNHEQKSSKDLEQAHSSAKKKMENKTGPVQNEKHDAGKSKISKIDIDVVSTTNSKGVLPKDVKTPMSSILENSLEQKRSSKDLEQADSSPKKKMENKTSPVQSEKRDAAKSKIPNIDFDGVSTTHSKAVLPKDVKTPMSSTVENNHEQKKSSKDLEQAGSSPKKKTENKTSPVQSEKRDAAKSKISKIDFDGVSTTNLKGVLPKDVKTSASSAVENKDKLKRSIEDVERLDSSTVDALKRKIPKISKKHNESLIKPNLKGIHIEHLQTATTGLDDLEMQLSKKSADASESNSSQHQILEIPKADDKGLLKSKKDIEIDSSKSSVSSGVSDEIHQRVSMDLEHTEKSVHVEHFKPSEIHSSGNNDMLQKLSKDVERADCTIVNLHAIGKETPTTTPATPKILPDILSAVDLTYETFTSGVKINSASIEKPPKLLNEKVVKMDVTSEDLPMVNAATDFASISSEGVNKMEIDNNELKAIPSTEETNTNDTMKILLQNENVPVTSQSAYMNSVSENIIAHVRTIGSTLKHSDETETRLQLISNVSTSTSTLSKSVTCDVRRPMDNVPSCSTAVQQKTCLFSFNEDAEAVNRDNLNTTELFHTPLGLEDISPTKLPLGSNQSLDYISPSTSIAEMNLVQTLGTSTINFMSEVSDTSEIDIQQTSKQSSFGPNFVIGTRVTEISCFVDKESTADHNYTLGDPLLGGNNEDKNILTTGLSLSNSPEEFQLNESHLEDLSFNENNFIEETGTLEDLGLLLPCKKEKPDFDHIIDDTIPKPEDIQNSLKHLNMLVDISQNGQPKTISVDSTMDNGSNNDCNVGLGIDYAVKKLLFLGGGEVTSQNNTFTTIPDIDNINIMESNVPSMHPPKQTLEDSATETTRDESNILTPICDNYSCFLSSDTSQKVVVEPMEHCPITSLDQLKKDYIDDKSAEKPKPTTNKTPTKVQPLNKSSKFATFLESVKRDSNKPESKAKYELENYTVRRHNRTPVFPPKKKHVTQQQQAHTKSPPEVRKNEILSFDTDEGTKSKVPSEAGKQSRIRVKTDLIKPSDSKGHAKVESLTSLDYLNEHDQNVASEVVLPFNRPSPSEINVEVPEKKSENIAKTESVPAKVTKHARFDKMGNDYIMETILNVRTDGKPDKPALEITRKRKTNDTETTKHDEKRPRKTEEEPDKARNAPDHPKTHARKAQDPVASYSKHGQSSDDIFDKLVAEGPTNKVFAQRITEQQTVTKRESSQDMLKHRGYTTVPNTFKKDVTLQPSTSQAHDSRYREHVRQPSDRRRDPKRVGYFTSAGAAQLERRYGERRHNTGPIVDTSARRFIRNSSNSYSSKSDPCTTRDYRSRDRRMSTEQLNNLLPHSSKSEGGSRQDDDKFSWIDKFSGSGLFDTPSDLFMPPGSKREDVSSRK